MMTVALGSRKELLNEDTGSASTVHVRNAEIGHADGWRVRIGFIFDASRSFLSCSMPLQIQSSLSHLGLLFSLFPT